MENTLAQARSCHLLGVPIVKEKEEINNLVDEKTLVIHEESSYVIEYILKRIRRYGPWFK